MRAAICYATGLIARRYTHILSRHSIPFSSPRTLLSTSFSSSSPSSAVNSVEAAAADNQTQSNSKEEEDALDQNLPRHYRSPFRTVERLLSPDGTPLSSLPLSQFLYTAQQITRQQQVKLVAPFIRLWLQRMHGCTEEEALQEISRVIPLFDTCLSHHKLRDNQWIQIAMRWLVVGEGLKWNPYVVAALLKLPSYKGFLRFDAWELMSRALMMDQPPSHRLMILCALLPHLNVWQICTATLTVLFNTQRLQKTNLQQLQQAAILVDYAVPKFDKPGMASSCYLHYISLCLKAEGQEAEEFARTEIARVMPELNKLPKYTTIHSHNFAALLARMQQAGRGDLVEALQGWTTAVKEQKKVEE